MARLPRAEQLAGERNAGGRSDGLDDPAFEARGTTGVLATFLRAVTGPTVGGDANELVARKLDVLLDDLLGLDPRACACCGVGVSKELGTWVANVTALAGSTRKSRDRREDQAARRLRLSGCRRL